MVNQRTGIVRWGQCPSNTAMATGEGHGPIIPFSHHLDVVTCCGLVGDALAATFMAAYGVVSNLT